MKNLLEDDYRPTLKRCLLTYHCLVFITFGLTYYFSPVTYPILGQLTGAGRFDDWWGTISAVLKYPAVTQGICTVPWMHIAFLKPLALLFSPYSLHIIYILVVFFVLNIAYSFLSKKIGNLNSILILFTYPLIFSFWRGNTDLIIFGLILCGCLSYLERNISAALTWFGIAATFKPFALLYLLIFNLRNLAENYKIIVFGTLIVLVLILLGNADFFNSFGTILDCGRDYVDKYVIGEGGSLHNNSLWGAFKFLVYYSNTDTLTIQNIISNFSWYPKLWPIFAVSFFILVKDKVIIFEKCSVSNSIFLLNLITVLLLPISPDYRLYFVSINLILISINDVSVRYNKTFILMWILLILLPKHIHWFHYAGVNFTINGLLNAAMIVTLLAYLLFNNYLFSEKLTKLKM